MQMSSPPTGPSAGFDHLLSEVSHELRAPLASVIGVLDVIADPSLQLEPAEVEELVRGARADAQQLLAIVDNLLISARLAQGRVEAAETPVALRDLADHVLGRFPVVRSRAFIRADPDAVARADPNLVRQILTNLIQNVERYAPQGAVEVECTVDGDRVAVSVSDQGPGVDPGDAERLFQRGGGSGRGLHLGLATSRRLARLMGGELELAPSKRGGATFTLTLPRSDRPAPATSEPHDTPVLALPPRARLLVEVAELLAGSSHDRVAAGLQRMGVEMAGAAEAVLLVRTEKGFVPIGSFAGAVEIPAGDPLVTRLQGGEELVTVPAGETAGDWQPLAGGRAVTLAAVRPADSAGVLVLVWPGEPPVPRVHPVVKALVALAEVAVEHQELSEELAFERHVRASVMDSLPIAISIFAGDPPRVIDWNQRERELLGLADDKVRPEDLEASQRLFEVCFADGTPLTVDNAPVTHAIRSGKSEGPFYLRLRRLDGSEVFTRTYCAPVRDDAGRVIGAVVTSEQVQPEEVP